MAMREVNDEGDEVYYILTDHLGSTSITVKFVDGQAQRYAQQWYKPWGEVREVWGEMPTDYAFTGQMDSGWGLYFYKARWYDPYLNRWIQPDSIVPEKIQGVQAWDRYA